MKIRVFSVFITLLSLFTFVSCDFHNQNVREYLEHWTNSGQIVGHSFENSYQRNSSGITCLPTDSSQTVTLELHNPQKYNLQFEYIFDDSAVQEAAETLTSPVTIDISDDRFSATAVFSRQFLQKIDDESIGGKNISGHITIFEPDSARTFDPYTIALSANSAPDEIKNPLMQLTENGAGSYILCFYVPTYSSGHKQTDTTKLYINGTSYDYNPVSGTVTGTGFSSTYSGTLYPCASNGLTFSSTAPTGYSTVYYETGEAMSDAEKKFEIKLVDSYGLSYVTGASNKAEKLNTPSVSVTTGSYAADEDTGLYAITITAPTRTTENNSCGTGVTLTYTIEQTSTGTPVFEGGTSTTLTGTALNSKTINLPKGTYTIEARASKSYYITSETQSVTGVKITQPAIFYVAETGNDDDNTGALNSPYRTIQKALDTFSAGVTSGDYESSGVCEVRVKTDLTPPSDFNWTGNSNSFVNISSALSSATIKITGIGTVRTFNANASNTDTNKRVVNIAGGTVEIKDIIITGGRSSDDGAGIHNEGTLTLNNVSVIGNTIYTSNKNIHGGGIYNHGTLTMTGGSIYNNTATLMPGNNNYIQGGGLYNDVTATLTNVSVTENITNHGATANQQGAGIYNGASASLNLDGCTVTGNYCSWADSANGGGIYCDTAMTGLTLKGCNTITENLTDTSTSGTVEIPKNIVLPAGKRITIGGNIAESSIGVYAISDPSIETDVVFTSGYSNANTQAPGNVFISDKGYGIKQLTSGTDSGEAAFAVSSGSMYLPTDYNFTLAASGATSSTLTAVPNTAKTITITTAVTRTEHTDSVSTTNLWYNSTDKKLYLASDHTVAAGGTNAVTWSAQLRNGGVLTTTQPTLNTTDGVTVTIPAAAIAYEDTYQLKLTATYMGLAHDTEFTVKVKPPYVTVISSGASATFDGTTAITDSQVFIAGRNLGTMKNLIASDHEVTQGEYTTYCKFGGEQPSATYGLGDDYPAYNVSWYDAIVYCNLRTIAEMGVSHCVYSLDGVKDPRNWSGIQNTGGKYFGPSSENDSWNGIVQNIDADGWRLPTEAEWEYLARGGNLTNSNQTTYSGSTNIEEVAWYSGNSGNKTHEVKTKAPNALGLYDMSGNVREWCWDKYNTIDENTTADGPATSMLSNSYRTERDGGCFSDGDSRCTVSSREYNSPDVRGCWAGFRVVRTLN